MTAGGVGTGYLSSPFWQYAQIAPPPPSSRAITHMSSLGIRRIPSPPRIPVSTPTQMPSKDDEAVEEGGKTREERKKDLKVMLVPDSP